VRVHDRSKRAGRAAPRRRDEFGVGAVQVRTAGTWRQAR
jgi:hypothetical protein